VLDWLRQHRSIIMAVLLLFSALLLYSANLKRRDQTTLFEKGVLMITSPFQSAIEISCRTVADTWSRYIWLMGTADENTRLTKEVRHLQSQLSALTEISLENERLRSLLNFSKEVDLPVLPAQVIAEDVAGWFRTVVIDKGLSDGVREGMPVVVAEGVVGRVIRSAPDQARVLLVTDPSSAVASLVQRNRTRGVCRGQGETLSLDFVLRMDDLTPGDTIVTSGTGGIFPKGLVVGIVQEATRKEYGLFQEVTVGPAVDFSRLEEVLVLIKEEQ